MQISKKFEQGIEHHTYQRLDSDYKVNLFWDIMKMARCQW